MLKTIKPIVWAVLCLFFRGGGLSSFCLRFLWVGVFFLFSVCCFAQGQGRDPGVLGIGDKVPDGMWNGVHVVSRAGVVSAESLAGYRGKLLILDFWSTWCGPCIRSLPELDSIRRRFGDRVQLVLVTKNTEAVLNAFLKNSDYAKGVKLPFVLNDSLLNMRFPHKSISHQVFIDRDGVVRAITGVNGATLGHIEAIVNGGKISFPLKDDFAVRAKSGQK